MLRHWPILAVMTLGCGRVRFDDSLEATATLDLDFTRGQIGGIELTRATPASYFDAQGILRFAAPNEPRFDHDPITRAPRGLLIESSGQNILLHSDRLDDLSKWFTNGQTTIRIDQALAPDGTLSADEVIDDDTGNTRCAQGDDIPNDNLPYAFSIYARAGTSATFTFAAELLRSTSQLVQVSMTVDLVAGTVLLPPAGATRYGLDPQADGWYRVWIVVTNNQRGNTDALLSVWGNRQNMMNKGSVFAWGAQIEQTAYPTSYIATAAVAVTRDADEAIEHEMSWLDPDRGTLRVMASVERDRAVALPATCLIPTTAAERLCLQRSTDAAHEVTTSTQSITGAKWPPQTLRTFAAAWDPAGGALWDAASGTVAGLPPPTQPMVQLGLGTDATRFLDGHLARVTYWPRRFPDTELPLLEP